MNSASEKVNNSLAQHSFLLDNGINGLQLAYNSEFEKQQAQLSNRLNSFYNIILITGMVGIFWMRYDLVHDTQLAPMMPLKIHEYAAAPGLIEYTP